jgi:tRNA G46 methylase TrmB
MEFHPADSRLPRLYRRGSLYPDPPAWRMAAQCIDFSRPLCVEVGCGDGGWLIAEACQRPGEFFVGIERTEDRSRRLLHNAAAAGLGNLVVLRADAVAFLAAHLPAATIDRLVIFYPNPSPKKIQANRRFFCGPAFHVFHDKLKPGGTITLASNVPAYVKEARENLIRFWRYTITAYGAVPPEIPPRTLFEKKYRERGDPLIELTAHKPATAS